MSKMVERVAKAIAGIEALEEDWQEYAHTARAAIAAMRPSDVHHLILEMINDRMDAKGFTARAKELSALVEMARGYENEMFREAFVAGEPGSAAIETRTEIRTDENTEGAK